MVGNELYRQRLQRRHYCICHVHSSASTQSGFWKHLSNLFVTVESTNGFCHQILYFLCLAYGIQPTGWVKVDFSLESLHWGCGRLCDGSHSIDIPYETKLVQLQILLSWCLWWERDDALAIDQGGQWASEMSRVGTLLRHWKICNCRFAVAAGRNSSLLVSLHQRIQFFCAFIPLCTYWKGADY